MMLLLIKTTIGLLLAAFCGVGLVRWWLRRHVQVVTHAYARSDGALLSWRQALSERIKDPLVVLVPLQADSTCLPIGLPERDCRDEPSCGD